jgi:hypothetical protein
MSKLNLLDLEFYVVVNSTGQYFRAKGYGGAGQSFVDDAKKCKVYGKIGPARSVVTYFANAHPQYPTLQIIKLNIAGYEVLDEASRVQKAKEAKIRAKAAQEAAAAKRRVQEAEKALKAAQDKLNQLKNQ